MWTKWKVEKKIYIQLLLREKRGYWKMKITKFKVSRKKRESWRTVSKEKKKKEFWSFLFLNRTNYTQKKKKCSVIDKKGPKFETSVVKKGANKESPWRNFKWRFKLLMEPEFSQKIVVRKCAKRMSSIRKNR